MKRVFTEKRSVTRKSRKAGRVPAILLAALLLCACAASGDVTSVPREKDAADPAAGEEKIPEKEPPRIPRRNSGSKILVDEIGYDTEDVRIARFTGEDLKDTFYLIRSETAERVFEGSLQPEKKGTVSGNDVWTGDFSGSLPEGTYYLQTAVIGQSEEFRIEKDFYKKRRGELLSQWKERTATLCEKENLSGEEELELARGLFDMGIAVSLFPGECESIGGDYEALLLKAEPKLSEAAGKESASLYLAALSCVAASSGEDPGEESGEEAGMIRQAALSLAQSRFSGGDQAKDEEKEQTGSDADGDVLWEILADAALFQLTGTESGKSRTEAFLAAGSKIREENFPVLWIYLTTKGNVDTDLCAARMKQLIRHCAQRSETLEAPEDLFDGMLLTLTDHVLSGKEYESARKAYYHKLSIMGEFSGDEQRADRLAEGFLLLCFGS